MQWQLSKVQPRPGGCVPSPPNPVWHLHRSLSANSLSGFCPPWKAKAKASPALSPVSRTSPAAQHRPRESLLAQDTRLLRGFPRR